MLRRLLVAISFASLTIFAAAQPPERPRDSDSPRPTDKPADSGKPNPSTPPPKADGGDKPARPSDEAVPGLGPTGPTTKLHSGFMFTEGPAQDAEGALYFSDVPASRIHRIDLKGKLSTVREGTNRGNGLMVNGRGEIVCCEGGGAVVAYAPTGSERRVLADKFEGKPFNSPNDLVVDRTGGVYFTDPHFGRKETMKQEVQGVYYVSPSREVTRLVADLTLPNGVVLSPDEQRLYVLSSASPKVMMYPVTSPGKLGPPQEFCTLQRAARDQNGGGDGCTVDTLGNLYCATRNGVQVYSPEGKLLGVIRLPEIPSNCTFGGADMKTLYATARTSVYALPMKVAGHRFPAGK